MDKRSRESCKVDKGERLKVGKNERFCKMVVGLGILGEEDFNKEMIEL